MHVTAVFRHRIFALFTVHMVARELGWWLARWVICRRFNHTIGFLLSGEYIRVSAYFTLLLACACPFNPIVLITCLLDAFTSGSRLALSHYSIPGIHSTGCLSHAIWTFTCMGVRCHIFKVSAFLSLLLHIASICHSCYER